MKFLLFCGLLFVVWLMWKKSARPVAPTADPEPNSESMLACAHCGVYCPKSSGVLDGDRFYCCDDHRRAGQEPTER